MTGSCCWMAGTGWRRIGTALATKFALHHPGVTTGVSSMHIEEYARMNIAAVDEAPLPDDVVRTLLTSHRFAISLSNAAHGPIAAADAMN